MADIRETSLVDDNQASLSREPLGRFGVQFLEGHWFIGPPGAAQRIEDAQWLGNWLAANGSDSSQTLDFAGDRELERRFLTEFHRDTHPHLSLDETGEAP
jgi:hypothetical protein